MTARNRNLGDVMGDREVSEREVQQHVQSNAAPCLYPRRVWFLDALPLASTTKIDRKELMRRAESLVAAATGAPE